MKWKFWKKEAPSPTPVPAPATALDFSHVTSVQIAQQLCDQGHLEKLLVVPERFGGSDFPLNTVFVPLGTGLAKETIDNTAAKMADQGLVTKYAADAEYRGTSHVPCLIKVTASHPQRSGKFEAVVQIW